MHRRFSHWPALILASLLLLLGSSPSPVWALELGPEGIVVSPDGKWVYVSNSASSAIEIIDAATNQLVASVPVDAGDYLLPGLAISPDGSRLYVSAMARDQIVIIDTAARKRVATVKVGRTPVGLALSPDGTRLYVANQNDDTVSVVDTAALKEAVAVQVGSQPNYLAVSPDGQRLYVGNNGLCLFPPTKGSVSVIDTVALQQAAVISVGSCPEEVAVSPDGNWVYVSHSFIGANQVDVIDTAADHVVATIRDGLEKQAFPVSLAVSPDGTRVYAGSFHTLAVIGAASRQVLMVIRVGEAPINLAVSPNGRRLYGANEGSKTVSVIDSATLEVVATIQMGSHPRVQ